MSKALLASLAVNFVLVGALAAVVLDRDEATGRAFDRVAAFTADGELRQAFRAELRGHARRLRALRAEMRSARQELQAALADPSTPPDRLEAALAEARAASDALRTALHDVLLRAHAARSTE